MDVGLWFGLGAGLLGILIAVGSILFTFLLIGGIVFWLIRRKGQADAVRVAAQEWASTTGTVTYSQVRVYPSSESATVKPIVRYTYEVNGQSFTGDCIRAGDKVMRIQVGGDAPYETVERYPVGAEVTVYYDPQNPTNCALER